MDSFPSCDVASYSAAGGSLPQPGNDSVSGTMPSGVVVKAVKAVKATVTTSGSACSIHSQPLAEFSTTAAGKVDPLPLQPWDSTFNKLKALPEKMNERWVESDVANFKQKLDNFNLNYATALQEAIKYDATTEAGWFGEAWTAMYLKSREPVCVNISFALKLNLPTVATGDPEHSHRSFYSISGAVLGAHKHLQMIQEKKLAVDQERGQALCMSQPEKLFSHRKACKDQDQLIPCRQGKAQHIIVLSKGRMHRVLVSDESGRKISLHNLADTLAKINLKPKTEATVDLTPMTSVDRNECTELQQDFIRSSAVNQAVWNQVEEAFCCVCLDDSDGTEDSGKQLLAGNGSNRCFDKSLQFIDMANGEVGVTIEHTPGDASAWTPLLKRIINLLKSEEYSEGELEPNDEQLTPEIGDDMKSRLASASARFKGLLDQVELEEVTIQNIDQDALRKQQVSPDAFSQLVFQLAARFAEYKNPATYESVSMRQFKSGRTDDLRSFSPEVMAFLNAFDNPVTSNDTKTGLLREALGAHKQKIKECKEGKGICRHLFALEKKWEALHPEDHETKPEIFTDPVFLDLVKKSTLSTSCVADPSVSRFVFGPVENDGLGIAYYPTENDLRVTVSWRKDNSEKARKFVASLERSANRLLGMLDLTDTTKSPKAVQE